ncbi:T9SS type A sorting domain-containing protein [bacterium]|nr:T9SS type A sorting domain-containing protein [bacterium]
MKHSHVMFLVLFACMVCAASLSAERVDIGVPTADGNDVQVSVVSSEPNRTVLRVELVGFDLSPTTIDQTTYYEVTCRGEYNHVSSGEPNLPSPVHSLIVPVGSKVSIRVTDVEYRDFDKTAVAPSKGNLLRTVDPQTVPYEFGPVYSSDEWWPHTPVRVGEPYILRDFSGVAVEVFPFQYRASDQALRALLSMTVEITAEGGDPMSVTEPKSMVATFDEVYGNHFLNYGVATAKYPHVSEVGDMLIIAADALVDGLDTFIEWKKQKGIQVKLALLSEVSPGADTTQIHDYIRDEYNANPNLAFVLLVGDATEFRAPYGGFSGYEGPCDPIYGRVAGTDNYPDVIVGRFSDHQAYYINRIAQHGIYYERDLVDDGNADWLTRSLGIATYEQGSTSHMQALVTYLTLHGYVVDALYETYSYNPPYTEVVDAINDGRGYVNYAGHGSWGGWATTNFNVNYFNQLNNVGKLPFIVSAACLNGAYDMGECFAERWLKEADPSGNPEGAVGVWMSSRQSSWTGGQIGQDHVASLLMLGQNRTLGGLFFNALCRVTEYGDVRAAEIWTVFGDPSVMVRTGVPEPLQASHTTTVPWDGTVYSVTVTDPNTSQPVAGAVCALYCGSELQGSAVTDANGLADIPLDPGVPMYCNDAVLTVTGFNRETLQESVAVLHDLLIETEPLPDTRNCIENPLEPQGYWIECEVFSSHPLDGAATVRWCNNGGEHWYNLPMTDLGDGRWGVYLPLQYAGQLIQYVILAENTNNDQYMTPEYSLQVIAFGVDLAVEDSAQAGFYGKTVWYDLTVTNAGILDDSYQLSAINDDWSTRIYESTGQLEIMASPLLQMDESYTFKVAVDVGSATVGDADTLGIVATSGIGAEYTDQVVLIAVSEGVTQPLPFAEYFGDAFLSDQKWDVMFNCSPVDDADYGTPNCWPGAMQLARGGILHGGCSTTLTSLPIDIPDDGQTYYLEYWIECGGSANVPEIGDDLEVHFLNDAGYWTYVNRHERLLKPDHRFRCIRYEIPEHGRHPGFQVRFTSLAVNNYPTGDDPEPPVGDTVLDVWYLENVHIGIEPLVDVPILTSPADGASSQSAYPTLAWQAVSGATQYQVVIDTNSINGHVHARGETDGLSWTVSPYLPVGTFKWKVRARGDMTPWGEWSTERTYTRTPYIPPPSCPVLFAKQDGEFVEHNPLLTACEQSDYRDIVTDYYHVGSDVTAESGRVVFQLREMEDEVTYLKDFRLMTVDHSSDSKVAVGVDGSIQLYQETVAPVSVVDQSGRDVTGLLAAQDGEAFEANGAGYLDITFDPPAGCDGAELLLPGGIKDLCNITKLTDGNPVELSHTQVALQTESGTLVEAAVIPSRTRAYTAAVPISRAAYADGGLTVRLSWNNSYRSDCVMLGVVLEDQPVVTRLNAVAEVVTSGKRDGTSEYGDDGALVLRKGDVVEYQFDIGTPVASGSTRDFVVVATGRYEPVYHLTDGQLPDRYELYANYPNPFNPTTTIAFALPEAQKVTIEIYNVLGEKVTTLVDGRMVAGYHSLEWDAGEYASGVYLYRLKAGDFVETRKMVLLK